MTRPPASVLLAVVAALAAPAQAGWRPVETLLIDAGRGGAAGKRCVDAIAGQLKLAGEDIALVRRTYAAIQPKLPATIPVSLRAWRWADTKALRDGAGGPFDAVIVVDCRPDDHVVEVMVAPASEGVTTWRLRGVPATPGTIAWLTQRIQAASYRGFEP
ncbi:MAG: hypothetical protein R3B06_13950 [Kofleriaceae bacterium]